MSREPYIPSNKMAEVKYRVRAQVVEILTYVCDHPRLDAKVIVFNKNSMESVIIKKSLWERLPDTFDIALGQQTQLLKKRGQVIQMANRGGMSY